MTFLVMLAKEFIKGMLGDKNDQSEFQQPPVGWIASEKWDGYRAIFQYDENGVGKFYSRSGKVFACPEWYLQLMPPYAILKDRVIDGELWAGRDCFELMGCVRKKVPIDEEWMDIQFKTYDLVSKEDKLFQDRLLDLKKVIDFSNSRWNIISKDNTIPYPMNKIDYPIHYSEQVVIQSYEHMDEYYQNILKLGGEGIMLKHPLCKYIHGRNSYLLKYKPSFDRECIIIGYKEGKGKYVGKLGGFICKPLINHDSYMTIDEDEDHVFTLSGMDDSIRSNYKKTHPINTIISFECSGYTDKGIPRFGRYIRKRTDVILKEVNLQSDEKLKLILHYFTSLEKYYRENQDVFRVKSYSNCLKGLKTLENDSQLNEKTFSTMKGIGKGFRDKIREIVETGQCSDYEKIKDKKSPKTLFLQIHGVGTQCANKLVKAGFQTIEDVEKHQNEYLNDVQKKGLTWFYDIQQRIPFQEIQKHEKYLKKILTLIDPESELTIAGSYRRKKKDSGDIDMLIKAKTKKTYDQFIDKLIEKKYIVDTLARGNKKFMGMSNINMNHVKPSRRIDIMYTKPEEYPFAILYFTGSGDFNQRMRNEMNEKGFTMNEYCVKDNLTKKKIDHIFHTEKDIFDHFGFQYVVPEKRIE